MFVFRFMVIALFVWALMLGICFAAPVADEGGTEVNQAENAEQMAMPEVAPAMPMLGLYGPYSMSREASGTSWEPDSTPMQGLHRMGDPWMTMWHGMANLIYDDQGGPRGDTKTFSNSMLMFMGRREVQDGAFGVRVMISADPLMGKDGYPELFQTGETADGVHPLIDRQHPHNLLMEAAGIYTVNLFAQSSGSLPARISQGSRCPRISVPSKFNNFVTPICSSYPRECATGAFFVIDHRFGEHSRFQLQCQGIGEPPEKRRTCSAAFR